MKFCLVLSILAYINHFVDAQVIASFHIKFYYEGGVDTYNKGNLFLLGLNIRFSSFRPTVLYFFAPPFQGPYTSIVKDIKDAYVRADTNFLLFDCNPIDYSSISIDKITDQLVDSFLPLIGVRIPLSSLDVVAVGAGADFAGHFGRKLKQKSLLNFAVLPRIVAIEPRKVKDSLADTDANFVMTIHTENLISSSDIKGHVAFWVNGGKDQPKCGSFFLFYLFNKLCSFKAAQQYWLEAVKSQSATAFPARKCNSYDDFKNNACSAANPIVYMNTKTVKPTVTGDYYLNVNKESPYSKATADP